MKEIQGPDLLSNYWFMEEDCYRCGVIRKPPGYRMYAVDESCMAKAPVGCVAASAVYVLTLYKFAADMSI